MGLVINTNVASINGQRNLSNSSKSLSKALERLSSGLRINRAGDDAAGLAISENLRSQVRGLTQAVRNANDGISLVQTAEGAIDTYTQICQRIRELAIQASSDVNSDQNRASIQLEIDQQVAELHRIATQIDFNGSTLFDGSFASKKIQVGAKSGQFLDVVTGDLRTSRIGAIADQVGTSVNQTSLVAGNILINGYPVPASASATAIDKAAAIQSIYSQTHVSAKAMSTIVTGGAIAGGTLDGTNFITINGVQIGSNTTTVVSAAGDSDGALRRAINDKSNVTGVVATLNGANQLVLTAADGRNVVIATAGTGNTMSGLAAATTGGRVELSSDSAFTVADGTGNATTLLGIEGTFAIDYTKAVNAVSVRDFTGAQTAIDVIDNALRQINDLRASMGAMTNRLENTVSNLQVVSENLSASDSRIRDADFAVETANLTRAQILQQSGVAVLGQANLTPQSAISLLQKATQ